MPMSGKSAWWWGKLPVLPWDSEDMVGLENRWKMRNISHELLSRALIRIRHVLDVRDYYAKDIAFEVGYIMGKVREKYRKMMEHYYVWRDKANGKSAIVGPGVREIKPYHFLVAMEHLLSYEIDIDKHCDVLRNYFIDDRFPLKDGKRINREIKKNMKSQIMKKPKTKMKKKEDTKKDDKKGPSLRRMEEVLKSNYRQQHLMRKLGLPINSTTPKKRFIQNWPVEGSWDFGPYDVGF